MLWAIFCVEFWKIQPIDQECLTWLHGRRQAKKVDTYFAKLKRRTTLCHMGRSSGSSTLCRKISTASFFKLPKRSEKSLQLLQELTNAPSRLFYLTSAIPFTYHYLSNKLPYQTKLNIFVLDKEMRFSLVKRGKAGQLLFDHKRVGKFNPWLANSTSSKTIFWYLIFSH